VGGGGRGDTGSGLCGGREMNCKSRYHHPDGYTKFADHMQSCFVVCLVMASSAAAVGMALVISGIFS